MNIYDEAIADAKALKKMAEQNAKNKVIEAITPKIRKLIEQKLNEEDEEVNLDLDALPEEGEEGEEDEEGTEAAKYLPSEHPAKTNSVVTPPVSGAPESVSNTVTTKTAAGTEVKISVNVDEKNDSGNGDITLNKESIAALKNIISSNQKGITVGECRKQIRELKSLSSQITMKEAKQFMKAHAILLENCKKIKNRVINNNNKFLKEQYVTMIRELHSMSKQNKFRQLVAEMKKDIKEAKLVFDETDFGQGADAEQMKEKFRNLNLGVEIAEEGGEEDDMSTEDAMSTEDTSTPTTQQNKGPSQSAPAPSQNEMSEFSDYEDEDEELEEMDEELEEMDEETSDSDDVMYEVNEALLKKELSALKKINESSKGSAAAAKMALSFGGGKAKGDPWADGKVTTEGSEEDESSVSEAKKIAKKAVGLAKKAAEKAKAERKARVEEARKNYVLQKRLHEATKAAEQLKTQLLETNLFNAKLLYVNKLMQNRSLNEKQQRSIVEALDKAKTVRECKLLFESLNESITSKHPLNEARIPGSSSRTVQSGSTQPQQLNESADSDRWAILAGLKK